MYKVVVISSFHEQGLALLRRDDIELHVVDDFSHESLSRALKDADAVTVQHHSADAETARLRAPAADRIPLRRGHGQHPGGLPVRPGDPRWPSPWIPTSPPWPSTRS